MEQKTSIYLPIDQLHPHPDNPRKDLGDLTELIDSIRKNGILQNLTVIPEDEEWTGFRVLIGHRRLAAAKEIAYIREVPCTIVENMSRADQIGIMLEENMQRNDLTYLEQAQSFQLMLDLGETVESVATKTGFSESTVRHRVEIAKLNPELVRQRAEHPYYQFSLTDYMKLEQVDDISVREEILKDATDGRDIEWKIARAKQEKQEKETKTVLESALKTKRIRKAKPGERWRSVTETVKQFDLQKEAPKDLDLPEGIDYCYETSGSFLYVLHIKQPVKAEETESEKRAKEREKKRKKTRELQKVWERQRQTFVKDLAAGHYTMPKKDELREIEEEIWKEIIRRDTWVTVSLQYIAEYLMEKAWYESDEKEKTARKLQARDLKPALQKLIVLDRSFSVRTGTDAENLVDYEVELKKELAEQTKNLYGLLERFGFQTDPEVYRLLDGDMSVIDEGET